MSITPDVEHHEIDGSEAVILQESCEEVLEPTILDFDDDIVLVEYESFACGFDIYESFNEGLCVEYEYFSVDPSKLTFFSNLASLNLWSLRHLCL